MRTQAAACCVCGAPMRIPMGLRVPVPCERCFREIVADLRAGLYVAEARAIALASSLRADPTLRRAQAEVRP
jgi:hypothetical protein